MRQRSRRLAHAGLATMLCLLVAGAHAQSTASPEAEETKARRYTVEVILFRYRGSAATGDELFPPDPPPAIDILEESVAEFSDRLPDLGMENEVLEEIVLPSNLVGLTVLPREQLQLKNIYDKLELLDAYEPVLWAGWTQGALERALSPEIPLRRIGNAPPEFDGSLQLYLSRFLHLVVKLSLTPDELNTAARGPVFSDRFGRSRLEPAPNVVRLRIDEDRIMKNGDLRYFDHPRFGLLAKVTRVEEPAIPANPAAMPAE
jgi:Peptidoglycan-binding protein, CsiV